MKKSNKDLGRHQAAALNTNMKLTEKYLKDVVRQSLSDAFKDAVASKERKYQSSIQSRVEKTVPAPVSSKNEDGFKGHGGRPYRPADDTSEPAKPEVSAKGSDSKSAPSAITPDAIINRLNTIRSGRSMRDKEIETQMDSYIKGLDDAEKVALYGFLKSIGQIVASDAPATDVKEPDDEPYNVKMKRVKDLELKRKQSEKQVQQDVKHADSVLAKKNIEKELEDEIEPSEEDTAPPIKVGQQTPESVRRRMKELMVK